MSPQKIDYFSDLPDPFDLSDLPDQGDNVGRYDTTGPISARKPGNIDLYGQPEVRNPNGSISTVDSSGYNLDGREVLLPAITPDGRRLLPGKEQVDEYRRTGRNLGEFNSPQESNAYAEQLHKDYESGKYKVNPANMKGDSIYGQPEVVHEPDTYWGGVKKGLNDYATELGQSMFESSAHPKTEGDILGLLLPNAITDASTKLGLGFLNKRIGFGKVAEAVKAPRTAGMIMREGSPTRIPEGPIVEQPQIHTAAVKPRYRANLDGTFTEIKPNTSFDDQYLPPGTLHKAIPRTHEELLAMLPDEGLGSITPENYPPSPVVTEHNIPDDYWGAPSRRTFPEPGMGSIRQSELGDKFGGLQQVHTPEVMPISENIPFEGSIPDWTGQPAGEIYGKGFGNYTVGPETIDVPPSRIPMADQPGPVRVNFDDPLQREMAARLPAVEQEWNNYYKGNESAIDVPPSKDPFAGVDFAPDDPEMARFNKYPPSPREFGNQVLEGTVVNEGAPTQEFSGWMDEIDFTNETDPRMRDFLNDEMPQMGQTQRLYENRIDPNNVIDVGSTTPATSADADLIRRRTPEEKLQAYDEALRNPPPPIDQGLQTTSPALRQIGDGIITPEVLSPDQYARFGDVNSPTFGNLKQAGPRIAGPEDRALTRELWGRMTPEQTQRWIDLDSAMKGPLADITPAMHDEFVALNEMRPGPKQPDQYLLKQQAEQTRLQNIAAQRGLPPAQEFGNQVLGDIEQPGIGTMVADEGRSHTSAPGALEKMQTMTDEEFLASVKRPTGEPSPLAKYQDYRKAEIKAGRQPKNYNEWETVPKSTGLTTTTANSVRRIDPDAIIHHNQGNDAIAIKSRKGATSENFGRGDVERQLINAPGISKHFKAVGVSPDGEFFIVAKDADAFARMVDEIPTPPRKQGAIETFLRGESGEFNPDAFRREKAPPRGEPNSPERAKFLEWEHGQRWRDKAAKLQILREKDPKDINWGRDWENDTKVRSIKEAEAEIEYFKEREKSARPGWKDETGSVPIGPKENKFDTRAEAEVFAAEKRQEGYQTFVTRDKNGFHDVKVIPTSSFGQRIKGETGSVPIEGEGGWFKKPAEPEKGAVRKRLEELYDKDREGKLTNRDLKEAQELTKHLNDPLAKFNNAEHVFPKDVPAYVDAKYKAAAELRKAGYNVSSDGVVTKKPEVTPSERAANAELERQLGGKRNFDRIKLDNIVRELGEIIKPQSPSLPRELKGAQPRFNMGSDSYIPKFESDVDKALFIIAQKTPSKANASYLEFVMKHTGLSEQEAVNLGIKLRSQIKSLVSGAEPGEVNIPSFWNSKTSPKLADVPVKPGFADLSGKGVEDIFNTPQPFNKRGSFGTTVKTGGQETHIPPSSQVTPPLTVEPPITPDVVRRTIPANEVPNRMNRELDDFNRIAEDPHVPPEVKQSLYRKVMDTQRALLTGFDVSFLGRQGRGLITHKGYWRAIGNMYKSLGSKAADDILTQAIVDHPSGYFKPKVNVKTGELGKSFAEEIGLELPSVFKKGTEENLGSNWAETGGNIPYLSRAWKETAGRLYGATSRANTAFISKARADVAASMLDELKRRGINPEMDMVTSKQIASSVNVNSGRGSFGKLEHNTFNPDTKKMERSASMKVLNEIFFAPKWVASRVQMYDNFIRKGLNPFQKVDPILRKEALRSLFGVVGTGIIIQELARAAGAIVINDPRDPDFRKIKIGDTRIDNFAGLGQYGVTTAQFMLGQKISSIDNKSKTELAGGLWGGKGAYGQKTTFDLASDFAVNRAAPLPSLMISWMRGKDFDGKPFEWKKAVANRTVSLFAQDLYDLAEEDPSLLPLGILPIVGEGIQTYGR